MSDVDVVVDDLDDLSENEDVAVDNDPNGEVAPRGRGRVSKYPEDVRTAAQNEYRKVYNRYFKANKEILKNGGEIEITAAQAAKDAKVTFLAAAGYGE